MDKKKQVAIIGAGVSGLTAGIYALKYGFDVTIFERNVSVGGLCTGWFRRGSYIDGCIHWLTESNRGVLNQLWRETGAIAPDTQVFHYDVYSQVVYGGKTINFYTNTERLEAELLSFAHSTNDQKLVRIFVKAVSKCKRNALTTNVPYHFWKLPQKLSFIWKIRSIIGVVRNYGKLSIADFARQFDSPELAYAFRNNLVPDEYSLFSLMSTFGGIASANSGTPLGGSKAMVERMKDKFIQLGGSLRLRTDVAEIEVVNNVATGLCLADGTRFEADYIIPACDLHFTRDGLLGGKYPVPQLAERDELKAENPTYSMILASFRTAKALDGVAHNRYVNCPEYSVLGHKFDVIYIKHFAYDASISADKQTTVVQAIVTTNEDMYDQLAAMQPTDYKEFKRNVGEQLEQIIYQTEADRYGQLELLDVATPLTFTHYVNAYKGTFMTYMFTKNNPQMILHNNLLPLRNVALAGHWMMVPGGVPIAAMQGKFAAQTIARAEGLKYK